MTKTSEDSGESHSSVPGELLYLSGSPQEAPALKVL